MTNVLLFGAFPYVAVVMLLVVSIQRYRRASFSISSLSSQFLEGRQLFWGSVPFHLGIVFLFFGHLIGFLIPRQVVWWNGAPVRLMVLELSALVAALLCLFGIVMLMVRRFRNDRLRTVTTVMDVVVYVLLLFQILTGIYIALYHRWGSYWYVEVMVPYLRSLFVLQPNVALVTDVPLVVKLHVLGAFSVFTVFSFSRLMHILVTPVPYVWRRPQLVLWNNDPKSIRKAEG